LISTFQDPQGHIVHPEIQNKGNGLYGVKYTPESAGNYTIPVNFGGKPVPSSPFTVKAAPIGDASKVKFIGKCLFYVSIAQNIHHHSSPSSSF